MLPTAVAKLASGSFYSGPSSSTVSQTLRGAASPVGFPDTLPNRRGRAASPQRGPMIATALPVALARAVTMPPRDTLLGSISPWSKLNETSFSLPIPSAPHGSPGDRLTWEAHHFTPPVFTGHPLCAAAAPGLTHDPGKTTSLLVRKASKHILKRRLGCTQGFRGQMGQGEKGWGYSRQRTQDGFSEVVPRGSWPGKALEGGSPGGAAASAKVQGWDKK